MPLVWRLKTGNIWSPNSTHLIVNSTTGGVVYEGSALTPAQTSDKIIAYYSVLYEMCDDAVEAEAPEYPAAYKHDMVEVMNDVLVEKLSIQHWPPDDIRAWLRLEPHSGNFEVLENGEVHYWLDWVDHGNIRSEIVLMLRTALLLAENATVTLLDNDRRIRIMKTLMKSIIRQVSIKWTE